MIVRDDCCYRAVIATVVGEVACHSFRLHTYTVS